LKTPVEYGTHPAPTRQEVVLDAWTEFVDRWLWEWMLHLTFRDHVHPERAGKLFRVLVSKVNRDLYGPRWYKKRAGIRWVRGLEYQKRGVIHFHALFAGVRSLRRLTYMDWWEEAAGYARIQPIESQRGAIRYIVKYVAKGGEVDLGGFYRGVTETLRLPFPTMRSGQVYGPEPVGGGRQAAKGSRQFH